MDSTENHDNHVYSWIYFARESVEFIVRALDFYISLLGDDAQELANDPDLAALITDDTRRELGLGRDRERSGRLREWIQEELKKNPGSYDVNISLSHGVVRFIKSVSLLYLAKLKAQRNALARRTNVTSTTLSAVDREISSKEELFSSAGVFKGASPVQLLAEGEIFDAQADVVAPRMAESKEAPLLSVERPRPIMVGSIELLDHELRSRCLDLYNQFQETGQSDRNDTVVSEASRILENRLRKIVSCSDGSNARQLATLAFNADKPLLRVSKVRSEQEAALHLFMGTFGFIRNQVQHKLLGSVPAERVLQILGWVDYLLSVIAQAEILSPAALPPESGAA